MAHHLACLPVDATRVARCGHELSARAVLVPEQPGWAVTLNKPRGRSSTVVLAGVLATATLSACGSTPPLSAAAAPAAQAISQAPANVAASVSDAKLHGTWEAPVGTGSAEVTSYKVFVGERPPVTVPATARSYDVKIDRDELLFFQVAAITAAGQGTPASVEVPRPQEWDAAPEAAATRRTTARRAAARAAATPAPAPTPAPVTTIEKTTTKYVQVPSPTVTVTAAAKVPPASVRPTAPADDWSALFARSKKSVVQVFNDRCDGPDSTGTAFFVGDRLLATAAHVVDDTADLFVVVDGKGYPAVRVGTDYANDLALLRIPKAFPGRSLELAGEFPTVGTGVVVIGHSVGWPLSMQHGVVSAVDVTVDDIPGLGVRKGLLQTDTQNDKGSSGGPVLTSSGEVVGIVSFGWGAVPPHFVLGLNIGSPMAKATIADWRSDIVRQPADC
jgi:S1-C subfamily serine protease